MESEVSFGDEAAISQFVVDEYEHTLPLEDVPQNAIVVHNVSAHSDLDVPLDLNLFLKSFSNAVYAPQDFNCVRLDVRVRSCFNAATRLEDSRGFPGIESIAVMNSGKDPVVAPVIMRRFANVSREHMARYDNMQEYCTMKASIFSNGKVSITGGKSLLGIAIALEKICRAVRRRINKTATVKVLMPTNILAVFNYNAHIVLKALEKNCKGAVYDPFRFAGVRIRVPVPSSQAVYNIRHLILTAFGKAPVLESTALENNAAGDGGESDSDFDEVEEESVANSSMDAKTKEKDAEATIVNKGAVDVSTSVGINNVPRNRNMKKHLHRFLSDIIPSNKRKIHQAAVTTVNREKVLQKRLKATTQQDDRVWLNIEKNQVTQNANPKEEVVTINVYTSGNVTFTGGRSIASIQYALSYIYPYLVQNSAKNVLN
ncbi:hypothetical protein BgAZ_400180 [Babesia gibsoni]|uniref:Uncharacterized protein n=1 Tax=Babesia gibsoni TaxID=33632 RepID=A0AAD8LIE1_BABGI|nr:hypothetical protein BgAZ_400180 [Babesia gibsoni]